MDWYKLTAETPGVLRDENGVPVEWTLLRVGDTPLCQEGTDSVLTLTAERLRAIMDYFAKKGEEIPLDSEHYLYELANQKKMDEGEALRLFPGGVAAMGYGALALSGENLRIRVKWAPAAYEFMKEKIYKYFSPVLRGFEKGPLRVTSVAMTNTPAINNLDALAASATKQSAWTDGKESMSKLNKALGRLLGREGIALSAETKDEDKDKIALEVEAKAGLIEQIKTLLGLGADAGIEEVIAALKAETDKAKTAEFKQVQLDELAASAEKAEHTRLVALGRVERKIVEADMEYVNSLDSKALKAHLDHTAPKFPAKLAEQPRKADPDTMALSAEEEKTIKVMKLNRDEYLTMKKGTK